VGLLAGVVLDHFVHPHHADRIHESFEVDRNRPALAGVRVLWPLHRKRHPAARPDIVHPPALDLEELDGDIHERPEFTKEPLIISFRLVGRTRAVDRDHLPRAHREVLAVLENEFAVKI